VGFFVPTDAELEAIEAAAVETATAGVSSFSSDGVSAVAMDPLKQLEVVERVERRAVTNPFATMRHQRIISPGGGGE
jgi:predicted protein tyrosine phosphatase